MSDRQSMFTLLGVTLPLGTAKVQYLGYVIQAAEAAWMGVENQSDERVELNAQVGSIEVMSLFYDDKVRVAVHAGKEVTVVMTNASGKVHEWNYTLNAFSYTDFGMLWAAVDETWADGGRQDAIVEISVGSAPLMRMSRYNQRIHETLGMSM